MSTAILAPPVKGRIPADSSGRLAAIRELANRYPRQMMISTTLLLVAAVLDGVGIMALLPLLGVVISPETSEVTGVRRHMEQALDTVDLTPSVEILLLFIVVVLLAKVAFMALAALQVGFTRARIVADTRLALMRSFLGARWQYFVAQPSGHLTNAVNHESQRASQLYQNVCDLVSACIQSSVYLLGALIISWQVTLAAVGAGAVMLVVLASLVRRARKTSRNQTRIMASFTARLIDGISGIKPLKAMNAVDRLVPLLSHEIDALRRNFAQLLFLKRSLTSVQEAIRVVSIAAAVYVALQYANMGLEALMVISVLFLRSVQAIGHLQATWQAVGISEAPFHYVHDMVRAAEAQRETSNGTDAPHLERGIDFEGVSFAYDSDTVLEHVDLHLPRGALVCFVGPSGAGKTTLIDLVIGLLRPTAGRVLVDGVALDGIDSAAWRSMIGYVPQEVFLFHDTLLTNVTLGDPALSRADAEEALRRAGGWDFVQSLPEGMDSIVGERGGRLSGGQRQRISIARALVRKPRLLILDEATSALDAQTEANLAATIRTLAGEMTVLSITHRAAMVDGADIIVTVEDGKAAAAPPSPAGARRTGSS